MWLPLSVRKHQRMRNYKECLQQYLPTNISSSRVICEMSKHKSYRFVLWEISQTTEFLSRSVIKKLLRGAKLALRKLQDHLLFSAVFSFLQAFIESGRIKLSISLRFDDRGAWNRLIVAQHTECQQLCYGKANYAPIHNILD